MYFWLGVEDFAKIESAKICISNYTLLVGPNNSGKSFLMQLAQGIGERIVSLLEQDFIELILAKDEESYKEYQISNENISKVVEYINEKLSVNKSKIIKEIFGKNVTLKKLYVDIILEKDSKYVIEVFNNTDLKEDDKINIVSKMNKDGLSFLVDYVASQKEIRIGHMVKVNILNGKRSTESISISDTLNAFDSEEEIRFLKSQLKMFMGCKSLFLPASRTGLLLLYREFFANKTDDTFIYKMQQDKLIENKEKYGGLTQPMYEFLRFLQTYSENVDAKKRYRKELRFFEDKLIEGHISVNEQGNISYKSKDSKDLVPMHLTSSMINEVTPIILAITSNVWYERLIIDEIEASLHPEKQLELVRFLNRLSNKGMKLILSTHSDTFVSKLNNLYNLSVSVNKDDSSVLAEFGLEKDDLPNPDKLFVYEFINQPNGKSIVKEIVAQNGTGYQFDLFTKAAIKLYEEAIKIGDLIDDKC